MFPGLGGRGMNPKKLSAMMRQMGIDLEDIDDVEEVVIRTADKDIVFRGDVTVSKMTAQGQVTWQIMGEAAERPRAPTAPATPSGPLFTEEDVKLVAQQAQVSPEKAREALEAAKGEPAEAILALLGE